MSEKSREHYLNQLSIGQIIAFRINEAMFTGKVIQLTPEHLVVKTKNGSVYYPTKDQVVWVKNGTYWPKGIYNALKLARNSSKEQE